MINKVAVYFVFVGESSYPSAQIPKIKKSSNHYLIGDNDKVDYYYFTNNKHCYKQAQKNPDLISVLIPSPSVSDAFSNNMEAKQYKVLPYMLKELQDYAYTFYVDTKQPMDGTQAVGWGQKIDEEGVLKILSDPPILGLYVHPNSRIRKNVFGEIYESYFQERYLKEAHKHLDYLKSKNPLEFYCDKFFQTGYIWRDMRSPIVREICQFWMQEIEKCGTLCQASFHFVYKKYKNYIKELKE